MKRRAAMSSHVVRMHMVYEHCMDIDTHDLFPNSAQGNQMTTTSKMHMTVMPEATTELVLWRSSIVMVASLYLKFIDGFVLLRPTCLSVSLMFV